MYSGLLRDEVGAKSVNVIGDTRNDIYQQVADKAEEMLRAGDYEPLVSYTDSEGVQHSVLTDATARSLRGNITRKLVKRPTMTVPYGVTKHGMSQQIHDELDKYKEKGEVFWEGEQWVANKLLTDLIHRAIYKVVKGARVGQDYLVKLARTLDKPAIWYSPIYNFPVHQPALKPNLHRIKTVYGTLKINLEGDKLDKRKQANQIAPNFIHSIDATVLAHVIENSSFPIGTIHDCFLVPPNYGYEVQQLYKEAFVDVMEQDPLRLIQQQLDPEEKVPFPEYGELDLEDVYDAQYIIS
jgi:DNA-directed RNA polymerase